MQIYVLSKSGVHAHTRTLVVDAHAAPNTSYYACAFVAGRPPAASLPSAFGVHVLHPTRTPAHIYINMSG